MHCSRLLDDRCALQPRVIFKVFDGAVVNTADRLTSDCVQVLPEDTAS